MPALQTPAPGRQDCRPVLESRTAKSGGRYRLRVQRQAIQTLVEKSG